VSDIPPRALRRSLRLAGLPAAHAGRAALGLGKRLGGRPAESVAAQVQARTAAQLFQTLGQLKGGAMKVGQALSAMEAALPAELAAPYRDALERLQEAAPPMPGDVVHQVLAEELGVGWRQRFRSFDDRPAAAASIGQVHRAVWNDGTTVAVKVQYPGAADALLADVRQLDRLVPLARLGAPSVDLPALFGHLRLRLADELDYEREAEAQRAFAAAFAGHQDYVVPRVVEVAPRVLVSEWLDGTPLSAVVRHGASDVRDRAGLLLLRLLLSAPDRLGRVHGDPHPGNFRIDDHGRLIVLDFGSSEPMAEGWPPRLGRLLRAGIHRDAASLHAEAVAAGLIGPDVVEPGALLPTLDPWLEPLRVQRFHFERSWLQAEVRRWSDPRGAAARLQRKVRAPPEHMLVQRVAFGLLGVLTSLDATVPVRAEVERWIPGVI
jgi:predicted unusual protein kinase regulating ubiquinone biosynthesis (AarF/ABC1/UbiB family)